MSRSVLTVGLDPALVSAGASSKAAFPGMDAERIEAGIAANRARLQELGFRADVCYLDYGATAEDVFRAALRESSYDFVTIGAGVRMDPVLTHLLEMLVNVTHELAPDAVIVFNTGPGTTAEAVERWFPSPTPLVDALE
ncbi:hypothetical protein LQ327_07150 [Actinomycetospora endophytica]|uniref:Uncharacterized protein n=1 Tax=Actinomycetospora endophytica TaxID=2291215 RepID=A0ABS8P4K0_9PSEU|nr:hypothetical protein [Actinomycetospora endophytica]MCD2193161.1 hypothetical protein [Actinomycetospora endophytica]